MGSRWARFGGLRWQAAGTKPAVTRLGEFARKLGVYFGLTGAADSHEPKPPLMHLAIVILGVTVITVVTDALAIDPWWLRVVVGLAIAIAWGLAAGVAWGWLDRRRDRLRTTGKRSSRET